MYHLADPTAYESTATPPTEALAGIDAERLRILGRLILAKRLGKIEGLLPATCRCASVHVPTLMRTFAAACLPTSLGRQDNARQFHDFVLAYDGVPAAPSYLADLVRLEYLAASATFAARDRVLAPPTVAFDPRWTAFEVRVPPELQLLETEFDLQRALDDSPPAALERGRSRLVAIIPGASHARVFWLEDELASVLLDIDEWTAVHAQDRQSVRGAIESLAARGLVEVRSCDCA